MKLSAKQCFLLVFCLCFACNLDEVACESVQSQLLCTVKQCNLPVACCLLLVFCLCFACNLDEVAANQCRVSCSALLCSAICLLLVACCMKLLRIRAELATLHCFAVALCSGFARCLLLVALQVRNQQEDTRNTHKFQYNHPLAKLKFGVSQISILRAAALQHKKHLFPARVRARLYDLYVQVYFSIPTLTILDQSYSKIRKPLRGFLILLKYHYIAVSYLKILILGVSFSFFWFFSFSFFWRRFALFRNKFDGKELLGSPWLQCFDSGILTKSHCSGGGAQ